MKRLLLLASLLTLVVCAPVNAHVSIRDTSSSNGAILHIQPDDDPIAGQSATIYYEIQKGSFNNAALNIVSEQSGKSENVAVELSGSTVSAQYIFPSQGTYNLNLRLSGDQDYSFNYVQRVSRGSSQQLATQPQPLAEIGLIGGASLLFGLCIVGFNRRKNIVRKSRM